MEGNENLTKQFDTMFSESGFSKNVHSSQGKCHAGNELILNYLKSVVSELRTSLVPMYDVPQCHKHEENN